MWECRSGCVARPAELPWRITARTVEYGALRACSPGGGRDGGGWEGISERRDLTWLNRCAARQAASGRLLLSLSDSESALGSANPPATPKRSPSAKDRRAAGCRVVGDYAAASNGFSSDQDRFVVWPDIVKGVLLLGVFDGHGPVDGGTVAEMAAERIPAHFQQALQESSGARIESKAFNRIQASESRGDSLGDTRVRTGDLSGSADHSSERGAAGAGDSSKSLLVSEGAIVRALRHAFLTTQRELEDEFQRTVVPQVEAMKERMQAESGVELPALLPNGAGTTATVAVLHGRRLYVAWVGDSRAALISSTPGSASPLGVDVTRDHDVDNEAERARAEEQGGAFVGRHVAADGVEGMVQTLRSLGAPLLPLCRLLWPVVPFGAAIALARRPR